MSKISKTNGTTNGHSVSKSQVATFKTKSGLAKMLKGGVIMDVMNVEQARIAEEAGAVAVMALERIPADIREDGGVARASDPEMIQKIKDAVTIPVMAKARITKATENGCVKLGSRLSKVWQTAAKSLAAARPPTPTRRR